MRRYLAALVVGCLWLQGSAAQAEAWTNRAGHGLQAELVAYDKGTVTLRLTNGAALAMPLSVLSDRDQARIKTRYGEGLAPDYVQRAFRDARAAMERHERATADSKTQENRQQASRVALAIFDERLSAQGATNLSAEVQGEIKRLRDTLR